MSDLFFDFYGVGVYGFDVYGGVSLPEDAGSFAEAVYAKIAPLETEDEEQSYSFLKYVGAIGQMLQDIDYLAHDVVAPWSRMLSIDELPDNALPWLGQFIGVRINPDFSADEQRQQIRSHERWNRGTPEAIRDSIRYLLSGSRTVEIVERYPDPYSFQVNTYASETHADLTYQDYYDEYLTYEIFYDTWDTYRSAWLAIQSNLIQDILAASKPGGLKFTYSVLPGAPGALNSYATLFVKYDTFEDLKTADQTYENVYFEV